MANSKVCFITNNVKGLGKRLSQSDLPKLFNTCHKQTEQRLNKTNATLIDYVLTNDFVNTGSSRDIVKTKISGHF